MVVLHSLFRHVFFTEAESKSAPCRRAVGVGDKIFPWLRECLTWRDGRRLLERHQLQQPSVDRSRRGNLYCSCSSRPCSGEINAGYLARSGEELESFTNDWQSCLAGFVAWQVA